jgi:hypothetical protein
MISQKAESGPGKKARKKESYGSGRTRIRPLPLPGDLYCYQSLGVGKVRGIVS